MDKLENTRSRVWCIRSMCRSFLPLILKQTVILTAMSNYFLLYTQIIDQWPMPNGNPVWGQRSRSHEGHYGTRRTALWSCTHISNIIDLSGKTKKLWSGQALLRRSRRSVRSGSRRKNQIKTICLPSFEGET
jgi:hypothetical protein